MLNLSLGLADARRLCRRSPGFVAFAVVTLALGIGASTLVFTLVQTALVRSLPFEDPGSLVWMYNVRTERERAPFSIPDFDDYRRANTTLANVAVFTNWAANLTGSGAPERLEGTRVSGNFFQVLGARAWLGRTLEPRDQDGDARVVVLTHGLWQRRFGGDISIVGRDVTLNGAAYTVVGVLPRGFLFPFREATLAVPTTLRADPRRSDRGANFLRVVARLKPDVGLARADADLDAIAARLQRSYPNEDSRKIGVNLYPLHSEIVRDYQQILWTLFAAVLLFMAIGCGNLANLLLVRSVTRGPEFVLRASLGASRWQVLRQLAIEALVIAITGGIAGAGLAVAGLSLWRRFGPADFPRMDETAIDLRVFAFGVALTLVVAVVCAVVPARAVVRAQAAATGLTMPRSTPTRRERGVQHAFVTIQVAGALVLLVCMGLVVRGFGELEHVDAGFTPSHALSMQLSLPPRAYSDVASIEHFYHALKVRLSELGGISAAGVVSLRPLSGLLSTMDVAFPDRPAPPPDEVPQAHFRVASAGYFAAAGIPILAGRAFLESDIGSSRPVAMVSQTFAERHWPGESAVGRAVQIVESRASAPMEVVGVVADVKQFGLADAATADLYVPLPQMPVSQAALLAARTFWMLRTDDDPRALVNRLPDVVHGVDPDVAASSIHTLEDVVDSSIAAWRVDVRLLQTFGPLAIVLCTIGVYAVASFSAGTRRRELAIQAALGATRRTLVVRTLREELWPVVVGVLIGAAAAAVLAPRLGSLLFHASPFDPWSYAVACASLLTAALVASYAPASRAGAANPADLLRM
jgi:putative ABC transport system permease protein